MRADPDAAMDRLFDLAVVLGDLMTSRLAQHGLTPARAEVIWLLHREGPLTQRQLSQALKCSPRNVTGLVDALHAAGFVTRKPHPTDRRAILVTLTPQGQALADPGTPTAITTPPSSSVTPHRPSSPPSSPSSTAS